MDGSTTVGVLEQRLFSIFPREDAESWDQPGLSVGKRSESVARVAVALDMNVESVIAASKAGCNVLVTHHPPFIKDGPTEFGPDTQARTPGPGRAIFEAAVRNVSCIAMHTNVDRAISTRKRFAALMGCTCGGNCEFMFDRSRDAHDKGFGSLMRPDWNENSTLGLIARVAGRNFDTVPRVWGDPDRTIEQIAFLNGSWNDPATYEACIREGVDCLIVGETRYHMCVDAQPFLSIIELGHDRSELPIVGILLDAVLACGIAGTDVVDLHSKISSWWTV